MNIWVEYYKYSDNRKNTHAQMKENAKGCLLTLLLFTEDFLIRLMMLEFLQNVWKKMETWCQSREMGVY